MLRLRRANVFQPVRAPIPLNTVQSIFFPRPTVTAAARPIQEDSSHLECLERKASLSLRDPESDLFTTCSVYLMSGWTDTK